MPIKIIEVKEETKKSKTKKYILMTLIVLFNMLLILLPITLVQCNVITKVNYSIDNFRYTLSALLQSLAAIFAFITSSTILLLQLSGDNSPKALEFFPKKIFMYLLVALLFVITLDTLFLLFLTNVESNIVLIILLEVIIINLITIEGIIYYILYIMIFLKPDTMFNTLIRKAIGSVTNEERLNIIDSLEELTIKYLNKGYSNTVRNAIFIYRKVIDIFIKNRPELNNVELTKSPEHPLRRIPESIKRVTVYLCRSHMTDLVHSTAWVFKELLQDVSEINNEHLCAVESQNSASLIIKECLENNLYSPAYNFSANFSYFDENIKVLDSVAWCLKEMATEAINYPNGYIVISEIISGLSHINRYSTKIRRYCIDLKSELLKHYDILDKKGKYRDKTIKEQLDYLDKKLEIVEATKETNGTLTTKRRSKRQ